MFNLDNNFLEPFHVGSSKPHSARDAFIRRQSHVTALHLFQVSLSLMLALSVLFWRLSLRQSTRAPVLGVIHPCS